MRIRELIQRLKAAVEGGSKYPRYIKQHPFNKRKRRTNSKHINGTVRPHGWKRAKRTRRKAEKLARRMQRR